MLRLTLFRNSKVLLARQLRRLHVRSQLLDARPYKMPAVSPTMEKGNIVEWKVNVGDKVSEGEVLLEVESDKAQVDVESPDEAKLAKILAGNGTKDIPVGQIIAWIADVDDDLSTLKIPEVSQKVEAKSKDEPPSKEEKPLEVTSEKANDLKSGSGILNDANPDQTLLPSVQALLVANGISKEDAIKNIKASGNDGRLLKGDILAYLGKIPERAVVKVAEYVKTGQKLDLSHIELGKIVPPPDNNKAEAPKLAKREPVVIKDQLAIQLPVGVAPDEYKNSLRGFVKRAFHAAHRMPLDDPHSQYYDEIFESLITAAPKKPRFSVSYDLVPGSPISQSEEILDFLVNKNKPATAESSQNYIFRFQVEVNDQLIDANVRAEKFVDSLKKMKVN